MNCCPIHFLLRLLYHLFLVCQANAHLHNLLQRIQMQGFLRWMPLAKEVNSGNPVG